ncbi:hypothetical protein [Polyangium fumosum]|uniref:Bacterial virulence factor lipase N-terminal domain-containing protein n=1 Tax=Polyangium fumosum TaxID=889272 RepID=A0A4U1JCL6_9BACT|nr:hypothetical protein [Polyangium fumosum]TKD08352.1 hypothetical protein E8A74_15625 [Polyangium fumosum]
MRDLRSFSFALVSSSILLGVAGCGPAPAQVPEFASIWVAPSSPTALAETDFFDHPWPSDLRIEDGFVPLEGFPNPRAVPILSEYITKMDRKLDGFSPAAAGYLRFAGPLDPRSLPQTPALALEKDASVQLLDIDPTSPEYGSRKLVSLQFRAEEGVYYPTNTLAFMPTLGFPLRPHTRYALVVTDAVRGASGGAVTKSAELAQVLGEQRPERAAAAAAKEALALAVEEIERAGIDHERIVHLAVFRTNDPAEELFAARDHLRANVPAPVANPSAWIIGGTWDARTEYIGVYGPSPNYQEGVVPFEKPSDGGAFKIEGGAPAVVDTFDLRFSLTVPNAAACPMPAEGFPIVLYAHGTGGDFRSYVYDGTARSLAEQCIASMGVDQIFHGRRPGAPKDGDTSRISLLFFNVNNVLAARTNSRQAALDEVQRARLFTESKMEVPASISVTGEAIRFDGSRLSYFGHSQGGLNGPLFLASDDQARGGVLSGSSAVMAITLLQKTSPSPSIAQLVKTVFLSLRAEEEGELDLFHPALSLAQMLVDATDPLHYARYVALAPREGMAAKSIYMTEGVNSDGTGDSYSPTRGIEMHAIAMGLPLVEPSQWAIPELAWGGPGTVEIPETGLSGNLADGQATGVLAQWPVPENSDGHFVVFRVAEARSQSSKFLRSLSDHPKGQVSQP